MRRAVLPLLLAGPLLLSGCGDDVAPASPSGPGATASPLQPPVASGVPSDAQPAQIVGVTVTGGEVTSDTGPVPVRLGSRVRLTVLSDVAGTVVVSGYDLREPVGVGRSLQLELVADRPGGFEVLLDDLSLTTLDVA